MNAWCVVTIDIVHIDLTVNRRSPLRRAAVFHIIMCQRERESMKSIKQLLRQPMKTLSGIILVALAVAILCLCLGQTLVMESYIASLHDVFTTIALPSFFYHSGDEFQAAANFPEEISQAIRQIVAEHPDVVKAVASPGLASAYIPALTMDYAYRYPNVVSDPESGYYLRFFDGHYFANGAVLEVTITKYVEKDERGAGPYLYAVIESTPGLAEDYGDLTGVQVKIGRSFNPDTNGFESQADVPLEIGQRYLIHTLRFDGSDLIVDPGSDEEPICQVFFTAYHKITANLDIENIEAYEVPVYARLDGTVEDFLASEEGAVWREALERIAINNHAFPVLGVDNLDHISNFNRGLANITAGRNFTQEELASGAKVCVISETVARNSGLSVGDTVTLQYYQHDENDVYGKSLAKGKGIINPTAEIYSPMTPFVNDGETYTIVGLYTQRDAWCQIIDNLYSFTPNTVFVPKNSVTVEMQYTNQGTFGVLELYDGTITEFYDIITQTGYPLLFECFDQGYEATKESLDTFGSLSEQVMTIGMVVYSAILLLFLLLFPAQQGRTMRMMRSLGTPWQKECVHILVSGFGILLPGTVLGTAASILLWDGTIVALTEAIAVELNLKLDPDMIIGVAAAQLLLALVLTLLVSVPALLSNPMKRK